MVLFHLFEQLCQGLLPHTAALRDSMNQPLQTCSCALPLENCQVAAHRQKISESRCTDVRFSQK
jgi:hypothetical protein